MQSANVNSVQNEASNVKSNHAALYTAEENNWTLCRSSLIIMNNNLS